MQTVNVSTLKNNPTQALRWATQAPVLVMNRDRPYAMLTGIAAAGDLDTAAVKRAMAAALFRDGGLSLTRAARVAKLGLAEFAQYLAANGIPVVNLNATEAQRDLQTLDTWLAQASS